MGQKFKIAIINISKKENSLKAIKRKKMFPMKWITIFNHINIVKMVHNKNILVSDLPFNVAREVC